MHKFIKKLFFGYIFQIQVYYTYLESSRFFKNDVISFFFQIPSAEITTKVIMLKTDIESSLGFLAKIASSYECCAAIFAC